jgi:ribosomal protein S18 acetylase RimI-like enzyme
MQTADWLLNVAIREASEGDLPALEWGGELVHFRNLFRQIYENTLAGKAVIWVADLSNVGLIGQLFVQLISQRQELADGFDRGYIYGFRIKPDYRNFGLGTLMLKSVENDLHQRNYKWITLNVGQENQAALSFYQRYGYQIIGVEPGRWTYIDHLGAQREVNEPAWRMEKSIG